MKVSNWAHHTPAPAALEFRVTCRRGDARYAAIVTAADANDAIAKVRQHASDSVVNVTVQCSGHNRYGNPCRRFTTTGTCAAHSEG